MNTRCYRCGWNFTMSREAIAAAVANAMATGAKSHVEHCPRCRQALKIPVDQLRRTLPAGWTPPQPAEMAPDVAAGQASPEPTPQPAEQMPAALAEPLAAEQPKPRAQRAAKTPARPTAAKKAAKKSASTSRKSAARKSAAKKSTRQRSKP